MMLARLRAVTRTGKRYDCGSKMRPLEAVMDFVLEHPEYSELFWALMDNKAAARRARESE